MVAELGADADLTRDLGASISRPARSGSPADLVTGADSPLNADISTLRAPLIRTPASFDPAAEVTSSGHAPAAEERPP